MKRFFTRGKVAVLVLLAVAITVAVFVLDDEVALNPTLEERLLSSWLDDLKYGTGDARNQAAEVIRRSGTNTLPALLQMLGAKDSPFKLGWVKLARKQSLISVRLDVTASERRSLAVGGFEALGSLAAPALPQLRRLARDKRIRLEVEHALRVVESDLKRSGQPLPSPPSYP